jgi:hypothetical protein
VYWERARRSLLWESKAELAFDSLLKIGDCFVLGMFKGVKRLFNR